jgi:homoserine O-acetyltransferase/O-succinyltransferase
VDLSRLRLCSALVALLAMFALSAAAAEYPAPKEGDWVAPDFKFHTGR